MGLFLNYSFRSILVRKLTTTLTVLGLGLVVFVFAAVLMLGMLPYQLAGYGAIQPRLAESALAMWGAIPDGQTAWFNFHWASRIYSAASFGIAILLAAAATSWKNRTAGIIAKTAVVGYIGLMAAFHAGLSVDWREANQMRNELVAGLVKEVPDLKPGSNLVFVDFQLSHKRVVVFRGWLGLKELVRKIKAVLLEIKEISPIDEVKFYDMSQALNLDERIAARMATMDDESGLVLPEEAADVQMG